MGRCMHIEDANSWVRYNGGCGCQASQSDQSCSSPYSPFQNIAPDGEFVDGDSPYAQRCLCKDDQTSDPGLYPHRCFWHGPAYNTSTGHFGTSELQHFVKQRLKFITRANIWDEAVIDGYGLKQMLLAKDPASAL